MRVFHDATGEIWIQRNASSSVERVGSSRPARMSLSSANDSYGPLQELFGIHNLPSAKRNGNTVDIGNLSYPYPQGTNPELVEHEIRNLCAIVALLHSESS